MGVYGFRGYVGFEGLGFWVKGAFRRAFKIREVVGVLLVKSYGLQRCIDADCADLTLTHCQHMGSSLIRVPFCHVPQYSTARTLLGP